MEVLAIIILGISAFVGFSTKERKSKTKSDTRHNDDPDWAFTESSDLEIKSK